MPADGSSHSKGTRLKTLIIGNGYLGRALHREYQKSWPNLICLDHKTEPKVRLEDPRLDLISLPFSEYRWAIITSAITNVALCEEQREKSYQCNVLGTLRLVDQILSLGMIPIIFSSDYVFDGALGGYHEESLPNPLNEYGRQKREIEQSLTRLYGDQFLLLRLSKVIGKDPLDQTVVTSIAQKLLRKEKVRALRDQVFSPIFQEDVIQAILLLQKANARGLYHLCGAEKWNRLELAESIAKNLAIDKGWVQSISHEDLGEPFLRPKRTDMVCEKLKEKISFTPQSLRKYIQSLKEMSFEKSSGDRK